MVKLLSDGSFPTLWVWLNLSQFDWIRACPFKLRGNSGHSPSSSLWCFTIPSDSLLLAMPPQIVSFLIFFNDHLECTLFCGNPSTMLRYQEWTKRHLNFRSDSLPCSRVPCLVCNQLPCREMPLWEALLLTYISPSSDTVPSCLHQSTGRESMAGLWVSALEVPTAVCGLRARHSRKLQHHQIKFTLCSWLCTKLNKLLGSDMLFISLTPWDTQYAFIVSGKYPRVRQEWALTDNCLYWMFSCGSPK